MAIKNKIALPRNFWQGDFFKGTGSNYYSTESLQACDQKPENQM